MSQVVLFYPLTGLDVKGVSIWLPMALLQTASTIADDYDVKIIDQRLDSNWKENLRNALTDNTLCVGISSMTGTQIKGGLLASQVVKEENPDIPVVWGGNHPTLVPASTAEHKLVDIVVMGEGESTFRNLVERLEKKQDWRDLASICFYENGQLRKNGTGTDPKGFVKQDEMPPLPYHLVDVEAYISGPLIFGKQIRALPYISSQGCPYSCTFCCQPVLSGRRWRKQNEEIVVERTLDLISKYNLDAIEFHDEEFFVNRKRGTRIAELIGNQYEWYVQTRMDDLIALDLHKLEENGLRVVQPGLETGSARMLELIKKEESLDEFHEANKKLAATNIRATYNFMMGYPTETLEDLTATVDLALQLMDDNPNASVSGFYVYVPYPGAELFNLAVDDGFEAPDTLEGWSVFNRQHLASPWIKDRKDTLEMLLYSSKFVDGNRLKRTFIDNLMVSGTIDLVSKYYRRKWRNHNFKKSFDIDVLAYTAKRVFDW